MTICGAVDKCNDCERQDFTQKLHLDTPSRMRIMAGNNGAKQSGYAKQSILIIITANLITFLSVSTQSANNDSNPRIVPVAKGWAKNSVNATIFRVNSITSHGSRQYIAFYDANGRVVIGKRKIGTSDWAIRKTGYKGDPTDAHNGISIAVDGSGILHLAWDHHCEPLRYCRSISPGSLELTDEMPMTGQNENKLTYPEFYNLPDGDLLFLYRHGSSGNGDTMLNRYDIETGRWSVVQHPLISGRGQRNAYTNQIAIDEKTHWHISWCWRETGDVATNHDLCYAKSLDGGKTWVKSTGEKYSLPITASGAEYICRIPQKSELINQTSMTVDASSRPLIATYWRPEGAKVPQYHLVYHDGKTWRKVRLGRRLTPFSLSGTGTKYLPICRPKVLACGENKVYVIFRDVEYDNKVCVAISQDNQRKKWRIKELTQDSFAQWEPSVDSALWERGKAIHLFLQKVIQKDKDVLLEIPPQMVSVLEWIPE